jgi:hypothetical protein
MKRYFVMYSGGYMDIVDATLTKEEEYQELIDVLMDKPTYKVNPIRDFIIHCVQNGGQVWEIETELSEVELWKCPEEIHSRGKLIYGKD